MSSPQPRPSARQLASLWETRVADEARAKPPSALPTTPTSPAPQARNTISANKPPMPPPLAPNPITATREEEKLTRGMVDAMSPVSSFHSSTPSSPSAPAPPLPPALATQVEHLSRALSECDRRMDSLEIRLTQISARITQLTTLRQR